MKFCKMSLFVAIFAIACLPAVAQTGIRVDIPFDFVAGGKAMPAGHYTVAPVFGSNDVAWAINGDDSSAMFLTNATQSVGAAHRRSLIFQQQGGQLTLVQIWTLEHAGREVSLPRAKQTVVAESPTFVEVRAE
ncbi:MAG TPA: hypothetical protein VEH30_06335 [Terriglobales bacterium]|nr:hypothetical protein [Terriglobales bacterium]